MSKFDLLCESFSQVYIKGFYGERKMSKVNVLTYASYQSVIFIIINTNKLSVPEEVFEHFIWLKFHF